MSFVAIPKHAYVRSPKLLAACGKIVCQCCGADDGTVVPAHSNWSIHGKGRSIKADDNRVAALCNACHSLLDQGGRLTEAERRLMWFCAHVKTVSALLAERLWPDNVPIPNLTWPEQWASNPQP